VTRPRFTVVGSATLAASSFLRLERMHLAGPGGDPVRRDVVRHPGAVAVVAVLDDAVVLIRQYRAAVDAEVLEIPAGKLDVAGEDPEQAARRELAEEAGIDAGDMRPLADVWTAPGFTDERMRIFLATRCRSVDRAPHGAEEEVSEVVLVRLDEVAAMIDAGEVRDAKTLAGLLMVAPAPP
jgi:nudix-type nucleoside diphosphatase (YffH/AdpP family)